MELDSRKNLIRYLKEQDIGLQINEWLSEVNDERLKSGSLQGPVSGKMKTGLLSVKYAVEDLMSRRSTKKERGHA